MQTFVKADWSAVEVKVEQRKVTVTGPKGKLFRDFGHLNVEITHLVKSKKIKVRDACCCSVVPNKNGVCKLL